MKRNNLFFLLGTVTLAFGSATPVMADQFHYKDFLVGERAAGLGGAFTAISDDPSGMYYNPAGMVFSMENYLSLSVNAYSSVTETYKNVLAGGDYSYNSAGLVPLFFGFTQTAGKGKFGFSVVVPNSDLIDQNDTISNISDTADKPNRLQRRFFRQDTTYLIGPAYAFELFENFTLGLSLYTSIRVEKAIDNQFITYNPTVAGTVQRWFFDETYANETTYGLQPKFGVQVMPTPKWALGATFSAPFRIAGSGSRTARMSATDANGALVQNGLFTHDVVAASGDLKAQVPKIYRATVGSAYFFSKQLLISADFDWASGDSTYANSDAAVQPYSIASTWNAALGTEWYLSDSLALRAGAYTNRANSPAFVEGGRNQSIHVDQNCGALGVSLYRPGTSLSLTGTYSKGTGKGQAIADTTTSQDVTRTGMTFYLTGSYQM